MDRNEIPNFPAVDVVEINGEKLVRTRVDASTIHYKPVEKQINKGGRPKKNHAEQPSDES